MPKGIYQHKSHSEEHKKNISESMKESCWNKDKQINRVQYPNFGHFSKHSVETIRKMRKSRMKNIINQILIKGPTSIEIKLYTELENRGLLFETQKLINGNFLVDAYIPSLNLVIEADGDYWHSLNRVIKKDKAENAYLTKCGYKIIRFSESEINNTPFGERIEVS